MPREAHMSNSPLIPGVNSRKDELEYMAYHGQYAAVYERYRNMPEQNRRACLSTYVLNAVVLGAIDRVKGTGKVGQPDDEEKASIERDLDLFIEFCNNRKIKPRELYECILAWADELAGMSHTEEAIRYFEKAEELGIRNYSDLFARLNLRKAELLCNSHGRLRPLGERFWVAQPPDPDVGVKDYHCSTSHSHRAPPVPLDRHT